MGSTLVKLFLPIVARMLVSLLSRNTRVSQLLAYIAEAERSEATAFGKRGYVYRLLKRDDPKLTEHVINTLVEIGVTLFKHRQGKGV